jgi:hypothetical protein
MSSDLVRGGEPSTAAPIGSIDETPVKYLHLKESSSIPSLSLPFRHPGCSSKAGGTRAGWRSGAPPSLSEDSDSEQNVAKDRGSEHRPVGGKRRPGREAIPLTGDVRVAERPRTSEPMLLGAVPVMEAAQ